jgi:hypothetical protein
MCRYRTTAEDMEVMGPAFGTLWERPVIEAILVNRFPDLEQQNIPLSDCCIGTLEWTLSVLPRRWVIALCGGYREYANKYVMGPIL